MCCESVGLIPYRNLMISKQKRNEQVSRVRVDDTFKHVHISINARSVGNRGDMDVLGSIAHRYWKMDQCLSRSLDH